MKCKAKISLIQIVKLVSLALLTIFCFLARKAWHCRHSLLLTAMKANTWVKVASAEQ